MNARKTALALALAGIAGTAHAQLEEVVVTAQKREASLQDTPIAITAFSDNALEQIGAFNPVQISEFTPNVNITKTFGSAANIRANIRGVSTGDPSLAVDPKVGMYVDGVYIARNAGAVFDIVDIERIEILRGPQGTLWGKNTTGGAINIITKQRDEVRSALIWLQADAHLWQRCPVPLYDHPGYPDGCRFQRQAFLHAQGLRRLGEEQQS